MYNFCTFFDSHYLPRGLALYRSLNNHCHNPFQLFVLCLDNRCYEILSQMNLHAIHLIKSEDFEHNDDELFEAKSNRTLVEYYFTCKPSLLLFILKNYPEVSRITYIDSDLFCFVDPAPIYYEISNYSIAITSHRFHPQLKKKELRGIYNAGFLSFKRDEHALECLYWWREKCVDWCFDRIEGNRYADQKYLDDWPTRFKSVIDIQHKGANLAPWNIANYNLTDTGKGIFVDNHPLIFFHFHGFRQINKWLYDPNTALYKTKLTNTFKKSIFIPYINELSEIDKFTNSILPDTEISDGCRDQSDSFPILKQIWWKIDKLVCFIRIFLTKSFIIRFPKNARH